MTEVEDWPAYQIERRKTESLTPSEDNARLHSSEQIAQIQASIREFGWTMPLLIDPTGKIIAGHGRYEAALGLGLTELPCIVAANWSLAQRQAYMLADNKLAENSDWDEALRDSQLQLLHELDFDLGLLGFDDSELDAALAGMSLEIETDGDNSSTGVKEPKLVFGEHYSRMTAEEASWLASQLEKHIEKCGSDRGFILHTFMGGNPHGA